MCCSFSRFSLEKQQRLNPEVARGEKRGDDEVREENEATRHSCNTNNGFNAQAHEPLQFKTLPD